MSSFSVIGLFCELQNNTREVMKVTVLRSLLKVTVLKVTFEGHCFEKNLTTSCQDRVTESIVLQKILFSSFFSFFLYLFFSFYILLIWFLWILIIFLEQLPNINGTYPLFFIFLKQFWCKKCFTFLRNQSNSDNLWHLWTDCDKK